MRTFAEITFVLATAGLSLGVLTGLLAIGLAAVVRRLRPRGHREAPLDRAPLEPNPTR